MENEELTYCRKIGVVNVGVLFNSNADCITVSCFQDPTSLDSTVGTHFFSKAVTTSPSPCSGAAFPIPPRYTMVSESLAFHPLALRCISRRSTKVTSLGARGGSGNTSWCSSFSSYFISFVVVMTRSVNGILVKRGRFRMSGIVS